MTTIQVCKKCNSDKVQSKEWVEINTGKNCGFVGDPTDEDNIWCPVCEEHVETKDKQVE